MEIKYGRVTKINNNYKIIKIVSDNKIYIGFQEKAMSQKVSEEDVVSFISKKIFLAGNSVLVAENIKKEKPKILFNN